MSSPVESRRGASEFALERRLAPHVDAAWAEKLVLELRLLGVSGDTIGAALSEVESHCADSGEGAPEAFGDAATYARSLDLPGSEDASPRVVLREFAPTAVQFAGMSLVSWSIGPMLAGRPLEITAGHLVGMLVAVLALSMVIFFADRALRLLVHRPVRAGFLLGGWMFVVVGVGVAALLLWDAPISRVGAGWGLTAGVALLAAGVGWALVRVRAGHGQADRITSPLAPLPPAPTRLGRLIEGPHLATLTATAIFPAGTAFLILLSVLLQKMTP
ncbi:MAG: hypothetical protein ACOH2F_04880 [Cellulomonas sp.]